MLGKLADSDSRSGSFALATGQAMFDWPEQIQTSPTNTSENVLVSSAAIVMVCGPPAGSGSSRMSNRPSLSDLAVPSCPASSTRTSVSADVQPQTWIGLSRWTTIESPKTGESLSSAWQICGASKSQGEAENRRDESSMQLALARGGEKLAGKDASASRQMITRLGWPVVAWRPEMGLSADSVTFSPRRSIHGGCEPLN